MPTTALWCMVAGFPPTPPYRVLPGVVRVGMLRAQASDEDEYLDDLENRLAAAARMRPRRRINSPPPPRIPLFAPPAEPSPLPPQSRRDSQLVALPGKARAAWRGYVGRPGQQLLLSSLSLLVGFYLAGSLSTISGAAGFWEPVIGVFPLVTSERITQEYYTRPMSDRPPLLKFAQALKVGWYFGICLDAIKLAG